MAETKGKIGSLFFGMTLDTNEFKKKVKEVKKSMSTIGKKTVEFSKTMVKSGAIAGAAMGAAGGAMLLFAKNTLAGVKAQTLLADSIGITQAQLAGLELLTRDFGVETQMVIDKMREVGGLEEFKKLADKIKGAKGEQAQLNKAVEIFGGEGAKMLAVLQQGSAGIERATQRAKELGQALSPQQVAASRVVWGQLADTWESIKGLAAQIGQRLIEPLGMMAAGTKGFIASFKDTILNGFEFVSNVMTKVMQGMFNLFSKYGIPLINGFISGAGQIGEAFSTLFSWLEPTGNRVFSGLSGFFVKVTDFLATIKDSLTFGITNTINNIIRGFFNGVSRLVEFIQDAAATAIALFESEDVLFELQNEFADQRKRIKDIGKTLAEPFKRTADAAFDGMVRTIGEQIDKNEKFASKFEGAINGFVIEFDKTAKEIPEIKKGVEAAAKKATEGVSKKLGGFIVRGSAEEQKVLQNQADKTLLVQKDIRKEQKKTTKAIEHIGRF